MASTLLVVTLLVAAGICGFLARYAKSVRRNRNTTVTFAALGVIAMLAAMWVVLRS